MELYPTSVLLENSDVQEILHLLCFRRWLAAEESLSHVTQTRLMVGSCGPMTRQTKVLHVLILCLMND